MTILLADDTEDDVTLVREAFSRTNVPVILHVVGDGVELISYLNGDGPYCARETYPLPDALLLDLRMPRKDGFEALAWIRRQPGLNTLPIVVLAATISRADVDRAYDLGANSVMIKAVDFDELLKQVETIRDFVLSGSLLGSGTT